MRADPASYELTRARSLDEALAKMAEAPGVYKPIAGGTDLMVVFGMGRLQEKKLIDLWHVPELRGIDAAEEAITFGALTTYTEVQESPVVESELPMLKQAASETGGWAIQNRGTLGGNIANASPAADSPPALLAYGADIELTSLRGARWVDYATFHTGYKTTVLEKDELITRIRVPRVSRDEGARRVHFYRKVGPRKAQAISKVCFAACVETEGKAVSAARIALGGVAPIILVCEKTAEVLVSGDLGPETLARATAALDAEIAPISDVRSTARYRRKVCENLLGELVRRVRRHVGLDR